MAWNTVQIKIGKDVYEVNQHSSNPSKFAFSSAIQMDGVKKFSCGNDSFPQLNFLTPSIWMAEENANFDGLDEC